MRRFDLQPTLRGQLLWLRPLREEDFEDLYKVSMDPLLWEMHPEKDRYQRQVFQEFFQRGLESKGAFIVLDAMTDEVIGSSRFNAYEPDKKCIEVGYTFLARRCWGKGYNLEMKSLMLRHAFQYVDSVVFYIAETNFRSRKAIEKIGARLLEKQERKSKEGSKFFAIVYTIKKSDYLYKSGSNGRGLHF